MTDSPGANTTDAAGPGRALLPTATPSRTRAAVRELLRPYRTPAVAGLGMMVLATCVGLLTQPLLGRVVDVVTERRSPDALAWPGRLARPDADDEELRDALATVGALGWAEALPEGLDTVVGNGGHRLTADRAQQLALARLLLADPPVVVLDERPRRRAVRVPAGSTRPRSGRCAAVRRWSWPTGSARPPQPTGWSS